MRKLSDLQQFCVILKYFVYFLEFLLFCFFFVFCEFWNFNELWRFTLRNDNSQTPAHLSKEDSIISMVQQFSCSAGAHKI